MDNGGPAFPGTHQYFPDDVNYDEFHGMTLRDYFAGQAMAALITATIDKDSLWSQDQIAECAYDVADAMLKARGEK